MISFLHYLSVCLFVFFKVGQLEKENMELESEQNKTERTSKNLVKEVER